MRSSVGAWIRLVFWCWFWTVLVCDVSLVVTDNVVTGLASRQIVHSDFGLAIAYGIRLVTDPLGMWREFQPSLSQPVACVVFYGSIAVGIMIGWGTASLSWSDGLRVKRP